MASFQPSSFIADSAAHPWSELHEKPGFLLTSRSRRPCAVKLALQIIGTSASSVPRNYFGRSGTEHGTAVLLKMWIPQAGHLHEWWPWEAVWGWGWYVKFCWSPMNTVGDVASNRFLRFLHSVLQFWAHLDRRQCVRTCHCEMLSYNLHVNMFRIAAMTCFLYSIAGVCITPS